jgi:hypothetical protein
MSASNLTASSADTTGNGFGAAGGFAAGFGAWAKLDIIGIIRAAHAAITALFMGLSLPFWTCSLL